MNYSGSSQRNGPLPVYQPSSSQFPSTNKNTYPQPNFGVQIPDLPAYIPSQPQTAYPQPFVIILLLLIIHRMCQIQQVLRFRSILVPLPANPLLPLIILTKIQPLLLHRSFQSSKQIVHHIHYHLKQESRVLFQYMFQQLLPYMVKFLQVLQSMPK